MFNFFALEIKTLATIALLKGLISLSSTSSAKKNCNCLSRIVVCMYCTVYSVQYVVPSAKNSLDLYQYITSFVWIIAPNSIHIAPWFLRGLSVVTWTFIDWCLYFSRSVAFTLRGLSSSFTLHWLSQVPCMDSLDCHQYLAWIDLLDCCIFALYWCCCIHFRLTVPAINCHIYRPRIVACTWQGL